MMGQSCGVRDTQGKVVDIRDTAADACLLFLWPLGAEMLEGSQRRWIH